MKLIKSSYKITHIDEDPLEKIEFAARDCYQSHDKTQEGSAEKLVANLIKRGHEAMLEFADMTVRFTCSRGIANELVRHRLCSFAQESTRYCDGVKHGLQFILPSNIFFETDACIHIPSTEEFEVAYVHAENAYFSLRDLGIKPEIARDVLPLGLATRINMKANMREWRHIFKLRTSIFSHPDMRDLMIPLLEEVKQKVPVLFDDIEITRRKDK
jgi:thymidylate synthase (FAD)